MHSYSVRFRPSSRSRAIPADPVTTRTVQRVVIQALVYAASTQKKRFQVYVTESRPVRRLLAPSRESHMLTNCAFTVWSRFEDAGGVDKGRYPLRCRSRLGGGLHHGKVRSSLPAFASSRAQG